MNFERAKNVKRNSIAGLINRLLTMFFPFLVRTVMIKTLGEEYLGLSGLFTSILTVLSLAELGFGTAVLHSMYMPVAQNDTKLVCALLKAYKKIYRMIGLVVLAIGTLLLPFLDVFIKGSIPGDINIYLLFIIYLSNSVASYWLFAYKVTILHAHQRSDINSKINTVLMFVLYTLQIIALIFTSNYYYYILLLPIYTIAVNLIAARYVKKMFPQYRPEGTLEPRVKQQLKSGVVGLMITRLSSISRNAFDSIIVSMYIGLATVAIYNNYYYILNSVTGLLLVFTSSISATVGNTVAIESKEKNLQDMNRLNFAYMWLSGWCTVCLVCLYQPFMKIWVGDSLMFEDGIMWLFAIYFIIIKLGDIQAQYFDATGLWWYRRKYAVIEAIGNLILNFVLGYYFGVNGVLIATILTVFLFNFLLSSKVIFKHYYEKGYVRYILTQTCYMMVSLLVAAIVYWITSFIIRDINNSWLKLVISVCICIIVPNILFVATYMRLPIFKETVEWIAPKIGIDINRYR